MNLVMNLYRRCQKIVDSYSIQMLVIGALFGFEMADMMPLRVLTL